MYKFIIIIVEYYVIILIIDDEDNSDFEKSIKNNTKWEQENIMTVNGPIVREENPRNIESKFKDTDPVISELERRTEYNPLFIPVNQDLNNDIYFIGKLIHSYLNFIAPNYTKLIYFFFF